MTDEAIAITGIRKRYGDIIAVDDLSLAVKTGELFGLIGPDGAGKTTIMQIICGLLSSYDGDCRVFGYDCRRELRKIREIIGYMPQRFSLYPDLTVSENLRFFADLFRVSPDDRLKRTERLLAFNRLAAFKKRRAGDLSGGMKQKLALSCTLIHTPGLLILDEPTTGVDPVSRREFWEILYELRSEGVTILVSTPYMDEAQRCDRIAFVHRGKVMAIDRPEQIITHFDKTLYALTSHDLYNAFLSMQGMGAVESLQLFGDRLHFTTPSFDHVKQELDQRGVAYTEILEIEPTIEDVFIQMMQRSLSSG
ncbi:ABC transporter ATP-binding protein [candidate division KSB1 bacterium]|nr:ABC transporter ATP-binding protein [candidate division KSB1 bacterium]